MHSSWTKTRHFWQPLIHLCRFGIHSSFLHLIMAMVSAHHFNSSEDTGIHEWDVYGCKHEVVHTWSCSSCVILWCMCEQWISVNIAGTCMQSRVCIRTFSAAACSAAAFSAAAFSTTKKNKLDVCSWGTTLLLSWMRVCLHRSNFHVHFDIRVWIGGCMYHVHVGWKKMKTRSKFFWQCCRSSCW